MAKTPHVLVVGSINMDLVVKAPHIPAVGETIIGSDFEKDPGGKGGNQAVAIARLGAKCTFLGRVGDDEFADELLVKMKEEGIDCEHLYRTPKVPSGVAMIFIDESGHNSIIVAPGANFKLTPEDVRAHPKLFDAADIVVMQMEVPLETVAAGVEMAEAHGCTVVLDPAPAPATYPPGLFKVDVLSPNETEAEIMTGRRRDHEGVDEEIARELLARGAHTVVLKLGERGCLVAEAGHPDIITVPAFPVSVVDSTAAGDAFTGALAVALGKGSALPEAVRFANAAGGLACSSFGAMGAMPSLAAVQQKMQGSAQRD